MENEQVELNSQELFLGLAMVLHSTAGNIEEGKLSYDDAKEIYIKVLPDISRMILQEHTEDEMISAAKKMGGLLSEIAKAKGIEISQ